MHIGTFHGTLSCVNLNILLQEELLKDYFYRVIE